MSAQHPITRRTFLGTSAAVVTAFAAAPVLAAESKKSW